MEKSFSFLLQMFFSVLMRNIHKKVTVQHKLSVPINVSAVLDKETVIGSRLSLFRSTSSEM